MKKILFFFCFSLLFIGNNAKAQLAQNDSTFVYVNGEGTFIRLGKGEGTVINLLSTLQSGAQFGRIDSLSKKTNNTRMSINLARIALTATNARHKVSAGFVTDFTGTSPILEGWIGFDVHKRVKLVLGQKQTQTNNRLAMADERYAQTMAQSLAGKSSDGILYGGLMHNFVGATREGGLFVETNFNIHQMRIYPSLSVTTGEGQNFFTSQPSKQGFKYGGRLDIMPLGDFTKNNAFIGHDLYREAKPKLVVGVAASYNQKASSPIGSETGLITGIFDNSGVATLADYRKLVADFAFKSNGFALVGEYVVSTVNGKDLFTNAAATSQFTPEVASTYYNLGSAYNLQSSYVFKSGWAVDGRYAIIKPEFGVTGSKIVDQKWATFGVNKFLKNNALRIGINTNYIEINSPVAKTKKWINNFAVQILL
ncbi:hypothetical protein [Pedobacter xixiisoli]|uniref:Porin n=1 Tax=Pedobacter xixiisoli TaxID=1476464 RepID=A0A286AEF0_9SPHI|nr:hypothetical protein [Pedobacter xixiisoli]SOD20274.1 hypothetical protein SAMN06297358_3988 [Pedobacter xixiisoli]